MTALFEAYITNLGKYNEGELVGETLKFPTTTEEVQALLKRIGVDGVRYNTRMRNYGTVCQNRYARVSPASAAGQGAE